jgi:hypothetical protein
MPPQISPYSIGSLIVAILGFVGLALGGVGTILGLIFGLLAMTLGGLAIRDISLGGSRARGTGLAVLAILIGGMLLVLNTYRFASTGCGPMNAFKSMYEKAGDVNE